MLIQDHENTTGIQEEKDIHYPTSDGKTDGRKHTTIQRISQNQIKS